MVIVCAWCQRYMGSREPLDDHGLSHGICDDCRARVESAAAAGVVLVVSRERAAEAHLLRSLFRGIPGAAVVVDRRCTERRRDGIAGAPEGGDRRSGERRRKAALFVV
jgi:cytochrome c5